MKVDFIIPVRNREDKIERCLKSVFQDGETDTNNFIYGAIVINDASTDGTQEVLEKWKKKYPFQLTVFNWEEHLERVYAFNAGMLQSQADWIIHLDSDDEMLPDFKKEFEKKVNEKPTATIINWGGIVEHQNGNITDRQVFKPRYDLNLGKCERFKSGHIFSGGFAFRRWLLNSTGYLPQPLRENAQSPYAFGKAFLEKYDELKPLYKQPDGSLKTDLGNPWGQDFAMFYMLTREDMPIQIDKPLHKTYVRP